MIPSTALSIQSESIDLARLEKARRTANLKECATTSVCGLVRASGHSLAVNLYNFPPQNFSTKNSFICLRFNASPDFSQHCKRLLH